MTEGSSFEAFADLLPEVMALVSADGSLADVNQAFCRACGRERETLVGRPLATMIAFGDGGGPDYLRRCASTRQLVFGAATLKTADGMERPYRAEGALYAPCAGEQPAIVLLRLISREASSSRFVALTHRVQALSDEIVRRRRAEREAERQRVLLNAASRAKDEFLATLSHELRTPLNAMLGWTRMMIRGDIPPARHPHALSVIARNAEAQLLLIEDLLDVSRITAGRLHLGDEITGINDVVRAAIDAVRPALQARQLQLTTSLHARGSVRGDSRRLQQVVWNLLSNAIKFTPPGGFLTLETADAERSVRVTVRDSGQGFSADFKPFLFDPFTQADASSSRPHGGLGLGLTIAQRLVEAHGGTITADSPGPDQGATFTVALPASAAPEEGGLSGAMQTSLPDLGSRRILVVDDDEDTRDLMLVALEGSGAQVTGASSAREALQKLQSAPPDLLIADIGMPGQDGFWLIRQLRTLPGAALRSMPAIAVTAFASTHDRQAALSAGFDDYVSKPVDLDELVRTIGRVAARRRKPRKGAVTRSETAP